jgi:hypothetical protein
VNQVDFWAKTRQVIESMIGDDSNDRFSTDELTALNVKMVELQSSFADFAMPIEQIKAINQKLDYVFDKAQSMNRYDWQCFFIGVLCSLIVLMAMSSENVDKMWHLAKQFLSPVALIP